MRADNDEDIPLRVLVVEDSPFQRRLVAETLRAVRRIEIEYADTAEQCLSALSFFQPDMIIVSWDMDGAQGVKLVKRLRQGEAGEGSRRLPIVIIASNNTAADVERARNAGVDEFVLRPFSTAILIRRVLEVRQRQREFIESLSYTGPDRRRRPIEPDYDGPRRRVFDAQDKKADAPDLQIRKGLARMYVERIGAQLRALQPNDRDSIRDLCLAAGQLSSLASDMQDRLLMSAASSLFNYIKGVGATGALITDVVQAHLDALLQLAELPNYQIELRQTVTRELGVMVTKKLRAGGAAA